MEKGKVKTQSLLEEMLMACMSGIEDERDFLQTRFVSALAAPPEQPSPSPSLLSCPPAKTKPRQPSGYFLNEIHLISS